MTAIAFGTDSFSRELCGSVAELGIGGKTGLIRGHYQ